MTDEMNARLPAENRCRHLRNPLVCEFCEKKRTERALLIRMAISLAVALSAGSLFFYLGGI